MNGNDLQQKSPTSHIPALDGIRGLAIVMVVSFHSGLLVDGSNSGERLWLQLVSAGWAGVDLFFVLSGFLITTILLRNRDAPHYFRNFFMRRVLRIFPLYFGSLLLLFSLLTNLPHQSWYWLFAQNWIPVFEGGSQPMMVQPFWSLAVEEQFYLVWPFVIFLIKPRHVPAFCLIVAALTLAVRCVAWWRGVDAWIVMTVTPFRLDALACGGLVAAGRLAAVQPRPGKLLPILFLTGLAGLVAIGILDGGYVINGRLTQTIGYSLFALMCAALVAMVVDDHPVTRSPRRLLEWIPLRHLGNRSYAIYVIHMPVLILAKSFYVRRLQTQDVSGTADVQVCIAAVVICLLMAEISWHLLEQPFLKLKKRFPSGQETVSGVTANAAGQPFRNESGCSGI
jgi:peptidoglycan/LPS O-acetylase OafA/YrhL